MKLESSPHRLDGTNFSVVLNNSLATHNLHQIFVEDLERNCRK